MDKLGKIIIIGAGPCGLGAAWALEREGFHDWVLLESAPLPGGLAASFIDKAGFTWDIGGHVVFSHYELFTKVLQDATEQIEHRRDASIFMLDRFVPYPFQYNIHHLPKKVQDECIAGLEKASSKPAAQNPKSFGEWIRAGFGDGIAKYFMTPYNAKVWGHPLEQMDWHWIGDRVARPDLARIKKNIEAGTDDVSWGPNSTFRFPLEGGTGAIWRAIAKNLPQKNLRYNTRITAIDRANRTCTANTGEVVYYGHLISTMPLVDLAQMCGFGKPNLTSNSGLVVGIGVKGRPPESLRKRCWIYFPEGRFPFYRATVFSNYSPKNAPDDGHWSLMVEVTLPTTRGMTFGLSDSEVDALANKSVAAAREAGLISSGDEIVSRWTRPIDRSYPIPTLARDAALAEIQPRLLELGIYSRGRFGAWKYEVGNMDHSFMQGVEAAKNILLGEEEVTVNKPEVVNKK